MKTTGIVFFIFAALNFAVALLSYSSNAADAAGRKMLSVVLLAVLGCIFYLIAMQKEDKQKEKQRIAEKREEEEERKRQVWEEEQRQEAERQKAIKLQKEKEAEKARQKKIHEDNSKKYKILNFYLDCNHCREQEDELKKCPLSLPVEMVDIENEEEIRAQYNVCQLPKLILVDYNGKEIKRWLGVTPGAEINKYLNDNGYANNKFNQLLTDEEFDLVFNDDEDCSDYPKPISELTAEDLKKLTSPKFMEQYIDIAAEGGTKEQTQIKIELLLGKREKTEAMLATEEPIRDFFHKLYDEAGQIAYNSSDNTILRKLAVSAALLDTYKSTNEKDGEFYAKKQIMLKIANKFGVSVNIIENEEKELAYKKYYK